MKRRQDQAYVLGTSDLGEADLIVTLLAESAGRVRGVAPSARRSRRRFGGCLDPMTRVQAAWTERQGRDLHRIEDLETSRSFARMQAEPLVQAACAVLCEVGAEMARENEADPRGFRLIGALLEAMEAGLHPWIAVRYFEFWTLRLHGVLQDPASCSACGTSLAATDAAGAPGAGTLCRVCARQHATPTVALRRLEMAFLAAASREPPSLMGAHLDAARPGGPLETFLRGCLEAFAERRFRTYRHLRAAALEGGSVE